uniref:NADH dehydrogenase subunit 2 n=1 Tax=Ariosoma meeki TaxID=1043173 RepID=UPI0020C858B5|nr:NADH dehydrogenase subunit 2 [Ariosoma meeki]USF11731.1 NADH dehydrogenase subunit 2 [Ariosoma meeki]
MAALILTVFSMSVGLGTAIAFVSSHWIMAWMGLEISTMAILPLMVQVKYPRAAEATTKYFIVQATATAVMIFAATFHAWVCGSWDIVDSSVLASKQIMFMALCLKAGIAPFHTWFPEVMQGLSLTTCLILSTWQKLAPMVLMQQIAPWIDFSWIYLMAIISALVGGWGGLGQTQIRKVMSYSSISHMGWMILVMKFLPELTLLAFSLYMITTATVFLNLKIGGVKSVNLLFVVWAKNPTLFVVLTLTILSLAGLPPLTGFMPKMLIMREVTGQGLPLVTVLMAVLTLLSLYFYLRLCYIALMTTPPNTNSSKTPWRVSTNKENIALSVLVVLAVALMPVTPALLNWLF